MSAGLTLADLERHDPGARPSGGERRFLCPLPACADHQRPPGHRSLTLATATGAWHCHRCGASGLLADFQTERPARRPGARGRDALRRATSLTPKPHQVAAPAPPCDPISADPELRGLVPLAGTPGAAYLERRGIPAEVARSARVRYAPAWFGRPAVVFPVRDLSGALVAAQGRYVADGATPKSLTHGRMSTGVFATPGALEANAPLVVTEAPIDALSLAAAGLPAVAMTGTTLRPWLVAAYAGRRVLLAFDADDAGDKAYVIWCGALQAVQADVYRLTPGGGAKDWNELLVTHGMDALRACLPTPQALEGAADQVPHGATATRCAEPGCTELVAGVDYCARHDPFGPG